MMALSTDQTNPNFVGAGAASMESGCVSSYSSAVSSRIDVKNYRSTTPTEQDVSEALDRWSDAWDTLASEQRGKGSIVHVVL